MGYEQVVEGIWGVRKVYGGEKGMAVGSLCGWAKRVCCLVVVNGYCSESSFVDFFDLSVYHTCYTE